MDAFILDALIDEMLLARLRDTTIDEAAWAAALASFENVDQSEVRRLKAAIRQAETAKDNIIASLGLLSNAEMVARAQAHFEKADYEIANLRIELARIESGKQRSRSLVEARPALELVIARWDDVPSEEKRALFEAFAHYIKVTKVTRHTKHVTVFWRDGSTSMRSTTHKCNGYFWDEPELGALREMIDSHVDREWGILRDSPIIRGGRCKNATPIATAMVIIRSTMRGRNPISALLRWQDTGGVSGRSECVTTIASDCSTDRP